MSKMWVSGVYISIQSTRISVTIYDNEDNDWDLRHAGICLASQKAYRKNSNS